MQECASIREQTEAEIASWWESRRAEDEELVTLSRQAGFEEGYRQGVVQAEEYIETRIQ